MPPKIVVRRPDTQTVIGERPEAKFTGTTTTTMQHRKEAEPRIYVKEFVIAAVASDKPYAEVEFSRSVTQCIGYQTVKQEAAVRFPVAPNVDAIAEGFNKAQRIVEDELSLAAEWSKSVIDTLIEVKDRYEKDHRG